MAKGKAGLVLPPRMRAKQTSSGKTYFYYDTCAKPRKWLPLGADYLSALKKYADLDLQYNDKMAAAIADATTFDVVAKRYFAEVVCKKAIRTQKDNVAEFKKLADFFCSPTPAPIDEIRPMHIRQYLDWRARQGGGVRANREVALFSHIFNKAREWGYTDQENPCRGISRNKEAGRKVYVDDADFWAVYEAAERHIQFVMLVAYLIGQRVADCLKIELGDIKDGALWIDQNKVTSKVRIRLDGVLGDVIGQILQERGEQKHDALFVHLGGVRHHGQPLTYSMLRGGMDRAREAAGVEKAHFQFRDLRAKAATDKDEALGIEAARALLGHKNQSMTVEYVRHRKGKLVAPTVDSISAEFSAKNVQIKGRKK